jgi:hypothetical protein
MNAPDPVAQDFAAERDVATPLDRGARAPATELRLGAVVRRLAGEATVVTGAPCRIGSFVDKVPNGDLPGPRNAPASAGGGGVRLDEVTAGRRRGENEPGPRVALAAARANPDRATIEPGAHGP